MKNRSLDRRRWNSIFDVFDSPGWGNFFPETSTSNDWLSPSAEVDETDTHYKFKFDLPGLKKEDVKIDLHDNQLTVSGERKEEKKEDDAKKHVNEFSYGSFLRSFTLPGQVDPERSVATYEDGVLKIEVPKNEESKARTISIR